MRQASTPIRKFCGFSRDEDDLRPVLARLAATRGALRGGGATGTERIAIARWLGELDIPGDGDGDECQARGLPVSSYVLCGGQVIRQPGHHHGADDDPPESHEERIDDLARAGALIATEIDRLQQLAERRYA